MLWRRGMNDRRIIPIVVLLTVYNRKSVKNTIDSILKQTFKDFELLIIDNASNDGTFELLNDYAKKDQRVVVVQNKKNMGQTYSLRRGMSLANGKYIARIDADDIMNPNRLMKQYEFLESHFDYGFCGSWVQIITDDNKLSLIIRMPVTDEGMRAVQKVSCCAYHPSVMMRKSTLEKYNITYDETLSMAEDYDMWRQLLLVSKGCNIPEVLTYYRRGNISDSDYHRAITRKEDYLVRNKVCEEDFNGKPEIKMLLQLERKRKKSIIICLKAIKLYKKYLNICFGKQSDDRSILQERIRSRFLGEYIIYNNTYSAMILKFIYKRIRKIVYRFAK